MRNKGGQDGPCLREVFWCSLGGGIEPEPERDPYAE